MEAECKQFFRKVWKGREHKKGREMLQSMRSREGPFRLRLRARACGCAEEGDWAGEEGLFRDALRGLWKEA